MIQGKIKISGTGCGLVDYLYLGVSFYSAEFRKFLSRKPGDGGLSPGKLVFTEELEAFAGIPYPKYLRKYVPERNQIQKISVDQAWYHSFMQLRCLIKRITRSAFMALPEMMSQPVIFAIS